MYLSLIFTSPIVALQSRSSPSKAFQKDQWEKMMQMMRQANLASTLPDDVFLLILDKLSAKGIARTSLVSKEMRKLGFQATSDISMFLPRTCNTNLVGKVKSDTFKLSYVWLHAVKAWTISDHENSAIDDHCRYPRDYRPGKSASEYHGICAQAEKSASTICPPNSVHERYETVEEPAFMLL